MAATGPLRILLGEDNAVNRRIALGLLERLGHGAQVAGTGAEVLEALDRQAYDVVLMDVEMPVMDGLEATRRIRARSGARPYVVAMTAATGPEDREACLAAGMDDHVPKPLRLEVLAAALARAPLPPPDDAGPLPGTTGTGPGRSAPAEPVLDPAVTRRLAAAMGERGAEVVSQLVDMFLTPAPDVLLAFGPPRAGATVEPGEIHRAAHTLGSNAASLGALRLAAACRDLEAAARAGDTSSLGPLGARVETEYAVARPALEALRAVPGAQA